MAECVMNLCKASFGEWYSLREHDFSSHDDFERGRRREMSSLQNEREQSFPQPTTHVHFRSVACHRGWFLTAPFLKQQRVRVNGCLSTSKSPKSGIPQGTVLCPVLCVVEMNDLPCSISSDCSIFADDTSAGVQHRQLATLNLLNAVEGS